ncbi:hypothetical protein MKW92_007635, partial [Papaver armeniacum]
MIRHLEVSPTNTGTKGMKANVETKTLSQIEDEVPLAIRRKALVKVNDNIKVVSSVVNDVINRKDRQVKLIGDMFDSGSKFYGKALKKTKPRVESKKQIDGKASGKSSKKEKLKDKEILEQVVKPNKRKGKQFITENQPPKKKQKRQGDCKEKDNKKLKDLHDSPFFHKMSEYQLRVLSPYFKQASNV